ncbi:MAG: hypothetical protein CVV03_02995 [Firmicutes bacterium HGW-Firmicutes-8]|nr:MAG: hypothetical protein CVV03_02995 [Firmicutes bacterium HGW-Firmicutes-8]
MPVNGHFLAFNRFVWLPKTGFPKIWPTAKLTQALGVTFLDSFICEHGFAVKRQGPHCPCLFTANFL